MKNQIGRFVGLIIVTVLALAVAIMVTTGGWGRTAPEEDDAATAAMPRVPVSVMEARLELIEITDTYSGMIRPLERFSLGFEVAGRVKELGANESCVDEEEKGRALDEGDAVVVGQVLARLDDRLLRSRLEEAKAQCEEAKARIEVATARRVKARADMKRSTALWRRGGGAISEAEYQDVLAALSVAEAQLTEAKAQLTRAEAQQATAEKNLNDATLVSPVEGVISKCRVNPGESVNPHQTVMEVIQVDEVLLVVGVPEAYVGEIHPAQPVHVELLARDRFRRERSRIEGRVLRVAEAADQTTGLFEVEIVLANPDRRWKPGLIALAHIVIREVEGFRIPMTSAVFHDEETFLFTVDQQGKSRRLDLKDWIEQGPYLILSELPAGRRTIVTRGQHRLVEGREVARVELPEDESGEMK